MDATCWGWREITLGQSIQWQPRGTHIGWLDGDDLYLEPDAAFAVAQRFARDQGDGLSVTKNTLWRRLRERGLLTSFQEGKNLARVSIGVKRRYAVHICADNLESIPTISGTLGTVGPPPSIDGGPSTQNVALESQDVKKEGQKAGTESPAVPKPAPNGPTDPEIEHKPPQEQRTPAPVQPVKSDAQEKEGFYP